jgi:hypothetical protein
MPEKTIKRRLQDCDAGLPQMTVRSRQPSPSCSARSSAPFPKERKTWSEKRKPWASPLNSFAGPSTRRSESRP